MSADFNVRVVPDVDGFRFETWVSAGASEVRLSVSQGVYPNYGAAARAGAEHLVKSLRDAVVAALAPR